MSVQLGLGPPEIYSDDESVNREYIPISDEDEGGADSSETDEPPAKRANLQLLSTCDDRKSTRETCSSSEEQLQAPANSLECTGCVSVHKTTVQRRRGQGV